MKARIQQPTSSALPRTNCSAKCPKCDLSYYVDDAGKCHRCGTKGITRQTTNFAEWYEAKIGVTLEQAKRAGVYDLALLEEAFNFLPNAQADTRRQ
jgi:hypothetical protein